MSRHDGFCVIIVTYVIHAVLCEETYCSAPCRCYWNIEKLTLTAYCRYTNSLRRIPSDIPHNATKIIIVGDLSKIEIFDWSNWTSLRSLALKGIGSRIGPFLLRGVQELEKLSLENNNISYIANDTFLNTPKIRYLDLSANALTTWESYRGLENLQTIHLRNNRIQFLYGGAFQSSKHLNYIGLNKNNLKELNDNTFKGLTILKTINLAFNEITSLGKYVFRTLKNLQSLDLRKNRIFFIDVGCFEHLKKLKKLSLTDNKLATLHTGLFSKLNLLQSLDLDRNLLYFNHDEHIFNGLSSLKSLDMSYNRLQHLHSGMFSPLRLVNTLYLKHNNITRIHPNSFLGLQSLRSLYLSFNNIGTIKPNTFKHLSVLMELHLHSNKITRLESNTFTGLKVLSDLFLSKNCISWVDENVFAPFKSSLSLLDLAFNSLRDIDENTLASLSQLNGLYLVGNRMKCSCKLTTLLRSMNIDMVMGDCFIVRNRFPNQSTESYKNSSLSYTLRNSTEVETETEYETFTNLTIREYHLLDVCGRGCENIAYFQLLQCEDCATAVSESTCSNFNPFRDQDFTCWQYDMRKNNNGGATGDKCKTSFCSTSQMCELTSTPRREPIILPEDESCGTYFADQKNGTKPIGSGNDTNVTLRGDQKEKYWSLLVVIVSPAAIVLFIILVVFIHTRSRAQLNAEDNAEEPQPNNAEGSPAYEDNANVPPPQSNNSEGSPAYEDNANVPPPQSNNSEGSLTYEDNANIPPPESNNSKGSPAYEDNANVPLPQSKNNEESPAYEVTRF